MENRLKTRNTQRKRRTFRVRKQVRGCSERPRMSVFKSNRHLSIQVVDDENSKTLFGATTLSEEMKALKLGRKSKEAAKKLGAKIAELAKQQNVQAVVFDRGRNKYHGLLAEIANAAREAGLQF